MAEINIDSDQYIECTDYFEANEWLYFQSQLNTTGQAVKQLIKKYGVKEVRDSRWPTRGVLIKKWGITTTITVDLNGQYLDESRVDYKREFYELRLVRIFYRWIFFYSSSNSRCLRKFSTQEIKDFDLVYSELEPLVKELAETGKIAGWK